MAQTNKSKSQEYWEFVEETTKRAVSNSNGKKAGSIDVYRADIVKMESDNQED